MVTTWKQKLLILLAVTLLATFIVVLVGKNRRLSRYKADSRKFKEICLYVRTSLRSDAEEIRQKSSRHELLIARLYQDGGAVDLSLLNGCLPNEFDMEVWGACRSKDDLDCLVRILDDAANSIVYP